MRYIALKALRWGERTIAPGEPVPEEEGRNYASLLRTRRIAEMKATLEMSEKDLISAHEDALREIEALTEKVAALEAVGTPAEPEPTDLDDLTRDELNRLATQKGVEGVDQLPNKAAVIEAIEAVGTPAE